MPERSSRSIRTGLVAPIAIAVCVGVVGAGDWSLFRGDAGLTGVARDDLPQDLEPLWVFEAEDGFESAAKSLIKTWHNDMIWFGPSGIGSTYTIDRYQEQHQRPFRVGLDNIVFNGHVCNYAEGNYAGWFGWPNLTMTSIGGFMGLPASDRRLHMRVVDIYRRDGDKLAENWIFIDMLYWMLQQDVDVLERSRQIVRG